MKLRRLISLSLLLLSANGLQAQTITNAEQHIKSCLDAISYWRFAYNPADTTFATTVSPTDSIVAYNKSLEEYLISNCNHIPQLLSGNINLPDNSDMSMVTADDKKMRIYSWDSHQSKEQPFWRVVALCKLNGKVAAQSLTNSGKTIKGDHKAIYSIKGSGNKNYYLAVYNIIAPNRPISISGVTTYGIENGVLKQINLFEEQGKRGNNIQYQYDYYANYSYDKMKEIHTIHLSKNKKKLYIPMVNGTILNGEWKVYLFDGEKFVYNKDEK